MCLYLHLAAILVATSLEAMLPLTTQRKVSKQVGMILTLL